jgi:hypothetical protein
VSTFDRLVLLRDCLCQQIVTDGSPPVCFCEVVPGDGAVAEYFNCTPTCTGMAWVRLSSSYPATSVGTPDTNVGNCGKERGMEVELGILRCVPSLATRDGRPVPAAAVNEAAAQQMLDMETLFRAVECCTTLNGKDFIVGTYTPLGPEGAVLGGVLSVAMI